MEGLNQNILTIVYCQKNKAVEAALKYCLENLVI